MVPEISSVIVSGILIGKKYEETLCSNKNVLDLEFRSDFLCTCKHMSTLTLHLWSVHPNVLNNISIKKYIVLLMWIADTEAWQGLLGKWFFFKNFNLVYFNHYIFHN